MEKLFIQFLDRYCDKRPLLLGLSGGSDSMALFHLLLEQNRAFQVAHIDHGWRAESGEEAAYLSELCQAQNIPYHLKCLSFEGDLKNLEDRARSERLTFFRQICHACGLQGVLLGHHADDQAETVLKRVLEGASLPKLKGLRPKISLDKLDLFRPFLTLTKKKIREWLDVRKIVYFQDPTNSDLRFLRGRMREHLLPTLSQSFGKTISTSLCRLGESAAELEEFLQPLLEPYRRRTVHKDKEVVLDCSALWPTTTFLLKAIIRDLFEQERIALSNSVLSTLVFHLEKRSRQTTIRVGKQKVILDRGVVCLEKIDRGK